MAVTKNSKKADDTTKKGSETQEDSKSLSLTKRRELLQKAFGKEIVFNENTVHGIKKMPTGLLGLDIMLSGGLPIGKIIEIYGPESSGKTSVSFLASEFQQSMGNTVAFVDAEQALDTDYAKNLGFDIDSAIVSQPDYAEQALDVVDTIANEKLADLTIIDSVSALTPKAEIEGDMGDSHMGLQARLMSQALRKITANANKSGNTIIFINQLRMKIGRVFGNPEVTSGGNALKFYASVRADVRRIGQLKNGDDIVGNRVLIKLIKNKTGKPFTKGEFNIMYGEGYDKFQDFFELLLKHGIIQTAGSWFTFGETRAQGKEAIKKVLLSDLVECRKAFDQLLTKLVESKALPESYLVYADLIYKGFKIDTYKPQDFSEGEKESA